MMINPSNPKNLDDICPICKRPKGKHSIEELFCSHKIDEFKKRKEGGAGIK